MFKSDDDVVLEEKALRQKEIDEWNSKIVVNNKNFKVNTKVLKS